MLKNKIKSIQAWLPIEEFYNDGIIKLKNKNYIKIIKINPINYELKSEFEKKAILNSYKTFLKNTNYNIQIIVQSKKEDLTKNIKELKKYQKIEKDLNNNYIVEISRKYINYIEEKNQEKLSSSKNFYILINSNNSQEKVVKDLKEKYFKIKNSLSSCGNIVKEIKDKKELEEILKIFLNKK